MEIFNLMEDIVSSAVDEICDEEARKPGGEFCTSAQCRMDVACFVLNRIPQQYISSGRGAAHVEKAMKENPQLMVDVVTLIHEGLRRVSQTQRPYSFEKSKHRLPEGPAFCFPTIKGRLFNCTTFEPVRDVAVELRLGGEGVEMVDSRWQNPFPLDPKIEGTFLFLPLPLGTDRVGEKKTFELEIYVEDRAFETFRHFFKIELTAETDVDMSTLKGANHKLPDLYLVPK